MTTADGEIILRGPVGRGANTLVTPAGSLVSANSQGMPTHKYFDSELLRLPKRVAHYPGGYMAVAGQIKERVDFKERQGEFKGSQLTYGQKLQSEIDALFPQTEDFYSATTQVIGGESRNSFGAEGFEEFKGEEFESMIDYGNVFLGSQMDALEKNIQQNSQ